MNFRGMIRILEKIDNKIYFSEKVLLCVLLMTMAGLAFFTVVLRLVFHKCFVGCEDLIQNMVLWCTFLGGAIGARTNSHLNINILQTYLRKGKIKWILDVVLFLVAFIVAGFLAWSGYRFVASQYEFGEDLPSLGMKLWVFQVILPYTFVIVSFRYLLGTLKKILGIEEQSPRKMMV